MINLIVTPLALKIEKKYGLHGLENVTSLELLRSRSIFNGSGWFDDCSNHIQVISPGRSGTRWLANLMCEQTNVPVVHSTPKTLAELGYYFNRGLISREEALGAYRFSRSSFLQFAASVGRTFVDLDCKNTPLVPVLADAYPNAKFLVAIRGLDRFVKSGVSRGYFHSMDPVFWGHLEPIAAVPSEQLIFPDLDAKQNQVLKIARFWHAIASIAFEMYTLMPERVVLMDVNKAFRNHLYCQSVFANLGLVPCDLTRSHAFRHCSNRNKTNVPLSDSQIALLQSEEFQNVFKRGFGSEFSEAAGLV